MCLCEYLTSQSPDSEGAWVCSSLCGFSHLQKPPHVPHSVSSGKPTLVSQSFMIINLVRRHNMYISPHTLHDPITAGRHGYAGDAESGLLPAQGQSRRVALASRTAPACQHFCAGRRHGKPNRLHRKSYNLWFVDHAANPSAYCSHLSFSLSQSLCIGLFDYDVNGHRCLLSSHHTRPSSTAPSRKPWPPCARSLTNVCWWPRSTSPRCNCGLGQHTRSCFWGLAVWPKEQLHIPRINRKTDPRYPRTL